ncbi:MAG: hypothetical protein FJ315_07590, partial [SAR202 cluster bacterium]|nr:hypothetical protein [SAR202 cluster bacterium]
MPPDPGAIIRAPTRFPPSGLPDVWNVGRTGSGRHRRRSTNVSTTAAGLRGVIAGQSRICTVDGNEGKLVYQGYSISDLAQHSSFEEVVYLLWNGRLPNEAELAALKAELAAAAPLPAPV